MYLSLHKAHGDRNHQPYANKKGRPIIHTVVVAHVALAIIDAIGRKLRNEIGRAHV